MGMTKMEGLNLLDYIEDVAKVNTRPMDWSTKDKQGNLILLGNTFGEPLSGPQRKCSSVIPSHLGENVS